jgi:hypothetical protein
VSSAASLELSLFRAAMETRCPFLHILQRNNFSSVVILTLTPRLNEMNMGNISDVLLEDQRPLGKMIGAFSAQVFEGSAVSSLKGSPFQEFRLHLEPQHGCSLSTPCTLSRRDLARSWPQLEALHVGGLGAPFTQGSLAAGAPAIKRANIS